MPCSIEGGVGGHGGSGWEIVPRTQRNNRSRQTTGRCYCLPTLFPLFFCLSVNSFARIDTQCRQEWEAVTRAQGSREVRGWAGAHFSMYLQQLYRCQQFSRFEYTQQKRKWANNSTEGKAKNKKEKRKQQRHKQARQKKMCRKKREEEDETKQEPQAERNPRKWLL